MIDPVHRAASHFGLGPSPGEREAIARLGPRRWLLDQLQPGLPLPPGLAAIPSSAASLTDMAEFERERAQMRTMNPVPAPAASSAADREPANPALAGPDASMAAGEQTAAQSPAMAEPVPTLLDKLRTEMLPQLAARSRAAVRTQTPFRERLVRFWSNHFTVSTAGARRRIATSCVGFENEAVRAHLDGSFAQLLRAVARHPVMLLYLENAGSVGPDSKLGRRTGRGLNENLARELMELHTLGVDGGQDQDDVIALARMISGWSVADGHRRDAAAGTFRFLAAGHEPGAQRLLGRSYRQRGLAQGEAALDALARHPATIRFLSHKLAVHFVADMPDKAAVARIEAAWRAADGHLPSIHAALVDLPGALDGPATKVRSADEFVVAALRGLDLPQVPDDGLIVALAVLGQFPFQAPSPAGWPDTAEHWASPNALLQRIDWAQQLAERIGSWRDPRQLAEFMLPRDDDATRAAVAAAQSPAQGLALLLGAPRFQWR